MIQGIVGIALLAGLLWFIPMTPMSWFGLGISVVGAILYVRQESKDK